MRTADSAFLKKLFVENNSYIYVYDFPQKIF